MSIPACHFWVLGSSAIAAMPATGSVPGRSSYPAGEFSVSRRQIGWFLMLLCLIRPGISGQIAARRHVVSRNAFRLRACLKSAVLYTTSFFTGKARFGFPPRRTCFNRGHRRSVPRPKSRI